MYLISNEEQMRQERFKFLTGPVKRFHFVANPNIAKRKPEMSVELIKYLEKALNRDEGLSFQWKQIVIYIL
jgi:hypothetical protein